MDVLVVDDDAYSRNTLRMLLAREGYAVVCAESGEHALELLRAERATLMLADIMMPEMSGPELVDKALEEGLIDAHRVVMISAAPLGHPSHASWRLSKPLDSDLVLRVVAEFCGPPRRRGAA